MTAERDLPCVQIRDHCDAHGKSATALAPCSMAVRRPVSTPSMPKERRLLVRPAGFQRYEVQDILPGNHAEEFFTLFFHHRNDR